MIQRISLLACLTACTFFHVSCKSVGTKSSEKDVAYKDSEGRFIYVKYSYQNKRYSLITCKENAVLKDVRRPNPFTIEGDKAQHEAYMKQLTENCPETAENRVMLSEDMMKTYLTDFYTYRHIAGNGEPVDDFLQWIRRAADLNKSREKERLTGELDRMKESLQSKKAVLKQIKKSGLISYLDQDKVYNLSADVDRLIKSIETYDPNKINTAPQIAWNLTWETNFANWMADKVYPLLTGSYETFILDKDNLLHSGLISAFTNYKNLKTAKFVSTSGDRLNLIKPSEDGNYLLVKGFNSYVYRTNQEQAKLSKIGGRLLEGHINSRDLAKSFTFDWDVSDGPKLTQIDQPALGQSNSGGAKSLKLPSSIANPIDRGITGNGNRIYAFSNRVLESWDVSNIDFVTQPKALKVFQPKPDSPIFDVRVSNDGKLGAIYYYDKIIVVAMDREVSPLQVLSVPNTPIRNYDSCIPYFSYDSKYIACIKSGMINVWNTATGKLHLSLNIATEPGYSKYMTFQFLPDSKQIFITNDKRTEGTIYDLESGAEVRQVNWKDGYFTGGTISPSSKYFVTESNGIYRVMNFETGERLKTIIGVSYIPGGLLDYPYGYFSNTTYSKDENTIHLTLGYDLVEWNWQNADDAEKYLPAPAIK